MFSVDLVSHHLFHVRILFAFGYQSISMPIVDSRQVEADVLSVNQTEEGYDCFRKKRPSCGTHVCSIAPPRPPISMLRLQAVRLDTKMVFFFCFCHATWRLRVAEQH